MTLPRVIKNVEKFIGDNSPVIMTSFGVVGVVATAYLASTATIKARELVGPLGYEESKTDYYKDAVKQTWKIFIPTIGVGAATITCIIGANRVGSRRTAALAAAYSLSEKAYSEYKTKVEEQLGKKTEEKIRDEIAQDKVTKNPPSTQQIILTGSGDVLCFDAITGRYFESSIENLRSAQNDINELVYKYMYASLSEFYDCIGLPRTNYSEEVGWNQDNKLNLTFSTTMSEDNRPCIVMDYSTYPIRGYQRLQ